MIGNPATRIEMPNDLRAYLADYLAWVERGAPEGEPYRRNHGLCYNTQWCPDYDVNYDMMQDALAAAWPVDFLYPFEGEYNDHWNEYHLNDARLAFVRANL